MRIVALSVGDAAGYDVRGSRLPSSTGVAQLDTRALVIAAVLMMKPRVVTLMSH